MSTLYLFLGFIRAGLSYFGVCLEVPLLVNSGAEKRPGAYVFAACARIILLTAMGANFQLLKLNSPPGFGSRRLLIIDGE